MNDSGKVVNFNLTSAMAEKWKAASLALKEAELAEAAARHELINACGHEDFEGYGVNLKMIERAGSVDYASIPQLKGVDLDRYRKKSTFYWTVKPSLAH